MHSTGVHLNHIIALRCRQILNCCAQRTARINVVFAIFLLSILRTFSNIFHLLRWCCARLPSSRNKLRFIIIIHCIYFRKCATKYPYNNINYKLYKFEYILLYYYTQNQMYCVILERCKCTK